MKQNSYNLFERGNRELFSQKLLYRILNVKKNQRNCKLFHALINALSLLENNSGKYSKTSKIEYKLLVNIYIPYVSINCR